MELDTYSKSQGGLGFRLMKDVNLSLISKLGWKLLTNHDNVWANQIKAKYIKYGNFFSSHLSSSSWVWNGIIATKPLLATGACFIPHKNYDLPIWSSPWVPTLLLFLLSPKSLSIHDNNPLVLTDLIHPSTNYWNHSL